MLQKKRTSFNLSERLIKFIKYIAEVEEDNMSHVIKTAIDYKYHYLEKQFKEYLKANMTIEEQEENLFKNIYKNN